MKVTSLDKHCAAELKALRKSHKIKQTAIADYLGLTSQQFYSDLENGKKLLAIKILNFIDFLYYCSVFICNYKLFFNHI